MIQAPGESVTFTCTVTGTTSPATWRRDNSPVTEDSSNSIDDAQNQLTVSNFSSNLAGNYTCVASNDVGSVSSSTAVLQVAGESSLYVDISVFAEVYIIMCMNNI